MKYLSLLILVGMVFGSNADFDATNYVPTNPGLENPVQDSRAWNSIAANDDRLTSGTIYDNDNDMIYMAGGTPNGQGGSNLPLIAAYDPVADSWNTGLTPMPDARGWMQGTYYNDTIRIVGGMNNGSAPSNTHYVYDIANNSWSTGAPLPRTNWCHGELMYNGSHYVVGGANPGFTDGTTIINRYDVAAGTWSLASPLLQSYDMGGMCIIDNVIYIIGGYERANRRCYSDVKIGTINPSDLDDITWTTGANLPTPNAICGTASLADRNLCFMLGGFLNIQSVTNQFQQYDPVGDVFQALGTYPVTIARNHYLIGRNDGGTAVYAIAGDANGNWAPPNNYYNVDYDAGVVNHEDSKAVNVSLSVTPTISNSTTSIAFSFATPTTVSLDLYNAAGQKVSSIYSGRTESYNTSLTVNDLPAGIYFVNLTTDSENASQKIVVTK